ncbi:MAG: hypothetical protein JWO95_1803 [Verrucomicrobiales bacterium]|nr:hypothetical protein [Verrucomicrobiales bacterium]
MPLLALPREPELDDPPENPLLPRDPLKPEEPDEPDELLDRCANNAGAVAQHRAMMNQKRKFSFGVILVLLSKLLSAQCAVVAGADAEG